MRNGGPLDCRATVRNWGRLSATGEDCLAQRRARKRPEVGLVAVWLRAVVVVVVVVLLVGCRCDH